MVNIFGPLRLSRCTCAGWFVEIKRKRVCFAGSNGETVGFVYFILAASDQKQQLGDTGVKPIILLSMITGIEPQAWVPLKG
jgi:hypothetical protein